MNVTLEQSIDIYARASRTRFGLEARQKTQERIEQLTRSGDLQGATIHERVKQQIIQLDQHKERPIPPGVERRQVHDLRHSAGALTAA